MTLFSKVANVHANELMHSGQNLRQVVASNAHTTQKLMGFEAAGFTNEYRSDTSTKNNSIKALVSR